MAELHHGTTLRPSKVELLTAWVGSQRWYAAKGSTPRLTHLASWRLNDPAGEVGIETHIVSDTGGPEPVTYQVPVTYRSAPVESLAHALIGTMEHGVLGRRWVYDAVHDPVYATQLLALLRGLVRAESSSESDTVDDRFHGEPASTWTDELTVRGARVLVGEQSNSSIILDTLSATGTATPVIVKVFRTLSHGDNPDVVLQSALRQAGCDRVPAVVGAVRGTWPRDPTFLSQGRNLHVREGRFPSRGRGFSPGDEKVGPEATGHLAFAQEFIPGTEDAWRVALRGAAAGTDFTTAAGDLGEATAAVHTVLADALPTHEASREDVARITAVMRRRLRTASDLVPDIARRADEIEAVFAEAETATSWPTLQRIHGDYHLGQVLHSPEHGWILLDFEGEPLRPLAERVLADCTFRDIAGMLRSFDYAGGSAEHDDPARSARDWVESGVTAFLDGYSRSAPDPRDHPALLRAFLLDKALYEVVYEARNRPTWLAIPATAISRLLDRPGFGRQASDPKRGPS